jgi:molecular chaperone GrpE
MEKQKTGEAKGGLFELTVKAVIIKDSQEVLLFKRSKNMRFFPGKYDLPGGSVESGEKLEEALRREISEEAGIEVEIGPVVYAFDFKKDSSEEETAGHRGKGIRFLAFYKKGEVKLNDENGSFEWIQIDEAIKKLSDDGYERDKRMTLIKTKEYLEQSKALDSWKRCQADFENYKKRQAENQKDFLKYACENIALEIIPVVDNFHASTDHVPEEQKNSPWVIGIMHIQKQLEKVLADAGVTEVAVKEGDDFDPVRHEAMQRTTNNEQPTTDNQEERAGHKIEKIILKGYKIGDRIIRPARVIVK